MKKYHLLLLLVLLPFWGCTQNFQHAPYQVIWSIFPFVKSFHHVTEMRVSIYERLRKRQELEFQGRRVVQFDSLGRSWVSHPDLDSNDIFLEYTYGKSYDSEGCPEYHLAKADSSGWVVFSEPNGIRNHCRDGLIDTFIRGDTIVVQYDSLLRMVKVEKLTRLRGDTSWVYQYDSLGRILEVTGPDNHRYTYPPDSIVDEYLDEFQERRRIIYELGREGLPIHRSSFIYLRKGKPLRLVMRWDYEYDWRDE